jgi:selenide, water dikinase
VPPRTDPRLIVGRETFDDAGIFVLSDDLALVQTVDFFAPIVDDPYDFGQIAAANALSDVFAMGGEPLTALNIVAFPTGQLPIEVLSDILRGGQDAVHAAGAVVAGGHTIIDEELKFGLAVTGRVHPAHVLTNAAAKPGDRLVLTKPLGTGILATAMKRGQLPAEQGRVLVESMRTLNAQASRCATDVTGFGFLGHASHIARASAVTLVIRVADLPLLPGVREALAAGVRTGGAERNDAYLRDRVNWGFATPDERALLIDPQTSGGPCTSILRPSPVPSRSARSCRRAPRVSCLREGVEGAWWLPRSSKPMRPDIVGSGGFDSHALPPRPLSVASPGDSNSDSVP